MAIRLLFQLAVSALVLFLAGCATYQTPGAGMNVGNLSSADAEIADVILREPASSFSARLSIARIQSTGYASRSTSCYGSGRYCLVTAHEIETEQDFVRIRNWPMVSHVAPMNRMLVAEKLGTIKDLRVGAASLKTDLMLMYSVDTRFNVDSADIGPLALISLGFLPNKKAHVSATASAALIDVRTGFVYGVAESTAREEQRATMWSSNEAVDQSRLKAETVAFRGLLGEVEKLWKGVVEEHAGKRM